MLTPLTPLSVSFVCLVSCVYLVRLSRLMRLSNASVLVRPNASISSISSVLCCASISCVCLGSSRLCYAVRLLRLSRLCCSYNPLTLTLVYSFKHVKPVNSFKRLVLLVLLIRPPKLFDPFDPFQIFQAFDSYNYPDNSSVSIPSKCLPPHALQRVKINFFKRRGKPERFEVFNSFEVFGVYGVYGEIKGVRRVRGFP